VAKKKVVSNIDVSMMNRSKPNGTNSKLSRVKKLPPKNSQISSQNCQSKLLMVTIDIYGKSEEQSKRNYILNSEFLSLDKQLQCFEDVKIDTKTVNFNLRIAKVIS
jgi:hypothetical protein